MAAKGGPSSSAPGDDPLAEARQQSYFRDIGIDEMQVRIRHLERKADALREIEPGTPPRERRAAGPGGRSALLAHRRKNSGAAPLSAAAVLSPRVSVPSSQPGMQVGGSRSASARLAPVPPASPAPESRGPAARRARPPPRPPTRDETEEAKKQLSERVQKFREDLVDSEWRQHEATLHPRPTHAERNDPHMLHFHTHRRTHHRVVIARDEREIAAMPKVLVTEGLKKSLTKMRENLFQRRLNLAIYERSIGDWSLPQIRAERRRAERREAAAALASPSSPKGQAASATAGSAVVPGELRPVVEEAASGGPVSVAQLAALASSLGGSAEEMATAA